MSVGLSKRWFAWALSHMAGRYDALLADRKRDLLGRLDGTIVEIGPGTGTNFRYYPRGVRWIGVEPNPYMHPYLRHAGTAAGIDVDVRESDAETMGLADGSADVVVTTAVLCSVHDQAKTPTGDQARAETRWPIGVSGACWRWSDDIAAEGPTIR